MDLALLGTLVVLGLGGGFLSGLLGLGGAIFMIPLLLYVPPILSVGQFDMKQVAAISMVQVLSASFTGVIVHNKNKFVSKSLLIYMGLCNAPLGNLRRFILLAAYEKFILARHLCDAGCDRGCGHVRTEAGARPGYRAGRT